ncbi:TonB-dependent receptor [Kordiimonas pumila]|uniref:TonB-dependent receptor n=1 Tax=Kordiimonas pumila TaxID=2161677 RepID=A0ABV7D2B6_9PROT|nr:TonB-dependent receptor [Kordiimonas pumila]
MDTIKLRRRSHLIMGASLTALVAAGGVSAQQSADTRGIEEVVVTAQKRVQSVQDVPVSMSAFDSSFTKRVNLDDVKDLVKFTPGFAGNSKDSFIDYINIRGISTNDFGVGGDPSVGFFKNGLYQGRNGVVVSSMFDMERAEVLRGPQGFLFGRNAISGAISLYTAKPDFENGKAYVEVGFGERGILEAEAMVNVPVNENFALRIAGYHSEEDGYVYNYARPNDDDLVAHNKDAFRVTAALRGESWDANLVVEYEDRDQSGSIYRAITGNDQYDFLVDNVDGASQRGGLRDLDSDASLGNFDRGEILSLMAEINWDLGFATLTSLTGYKDHNYQYAEDFDAMPYGANDYAQDQEGDYFEQELRLVSQGDGPLSWYAGVSYYKENITARFDERADEEVMCQSYYYYSCSDLFAYWGYADFTPSDVGLLESNIDTGEYKGWGAYVDLTYAVSEKFEIGVGMRYTKDTKNFGISILPVESELGPFYIFGVTTDGFDYGKQSWDAFTPRFVARYMPNDDWTLYASVTKGYKSGGFGSFAIEDPNDSVTDDLVVIDGVPNAFDPETVWSYEVGAKTDLFDSRLRLDMNAYYYKYKDLQLSYFDNGARVGNIGKAKAFGIETSAQAVLSQNFDLYIVGSYINNEVNDANDIEPGSDGNELPGTPKWTTAGVLSYHQEAGNGEINASAEYRTQSGTYAGLGNLVDSRNPGWTDVSLRLGYESFNGWAVTAYVENLFDEIYFDGSNDGAGPIPHKYFGVSRPRTFGVKLSYRFGD